MWENLIAACLFRSSGLLCYDEIENALQVYEEARDDWLRTSFTEDGDAYCWNVGVWALLLRELIIKQQLELAEKAWKIYLKHKPEEVPVHLEVWTALLSAFGKIEDWERVGQLWRLIKESGTVLNSHATTTMMHLLFKSGQPLDAFLMFEELKSDFAKRKEMLPEATINVLLIELCLHDQIGDAEQLVMQMLQEEDSALPRPGVNTMNVLLKAYGRYGTLNDIDQGLQRMVALGIKPNVDTFPAILQTLSRRGLESPMEALLGLMKSAGVEPNSKLIKALSKRLASTAESAAEALDSTLSLLFAMETQGPPPDVVMYTAVVSLLHRLSDQFDGFRESVELPARYKLEMADYKLRAYKIDVELFRQRLPSYLLMLLLLEEMKTKGIERTRTIYHIFLKAMLQSPIRDASGNALSTELFVKLRSQSFTVVGKLLDEMQSPFEPGERTLMGVMEQLLLISKYSIRELVPDFWVLEKKLRRCVTKMEGDKKYVRGTFDTLCIRFKRLSNDNHTPSAMSEYTALFE